KLLPSPFGTSSGIISHRNSRESSARTERGKLPTKILMNFAIVSPSNQGRVALVHLVQCLPTSTATAPPTLNSKTIRLEFVRLETRAGLGRAQNAQPALRPVEHIEHRLGDRLVVHGRQADGQGAQ